MKKYIYYIILMILSIFYYAKSNDSTYVTPPELEEGWGLYSHDPTNNLYPIPHAKSYLLEILVSPDNNWLLFIDGNFTLRLLNLVNNHIDFTDFNVSYCGGWMPNSSEYLYTTVAMSSGLQKPFLIFYNIFNQKRDSIFCPDSLQNCNMGGNFGPDGNSYFAYPKGYDVHKGADYKDSILYCMLTDSSRKIGYPIYKIISKKDTVLYPPPIFPPITINYYTNNYNPDLNDYRLIEGFDVTTNFKYPFRSKIRFKSPSNNWQFCECNTIGTNIDWPDKFILAGPRGETYFYLTFRSIQDVNNGCIPIYWDSLDLAARDASGWYVCDTSGKNLIQLVRSWTAGMGGISITADGNTIYYGMLDKDSNAAIYRMNRFGKQKERVINLGELYTDVNNEKPNQINNDNSIVVANSDEVTLNLKELWNSKVNVGIYDLFGRQVNNSSYTNIGNRLIINIGNLPNGIYVISCSDGGSVQYFKILKE